MSENTDLQFGLPDIWKRGIFAGVLTMLTISTVYLYNDAKELQTELIQTNQLCNELERKARIEKDSLQQAHFKTLLEQKQELQQLFMEQLRTEKTLKRIKQDEIHEN